MNDQNALWDKAHQQNQVKHSSDEGTNFAKEVESQIPKNSNILELGCGAGNDAAFFALAGHRVIATDFSQSAIDKNKEKYKEIPNLGFEVLDMENSFPFEDQSFDVIYARLSLHYFTDKKTKEIFSELSRVLKSGGTLVFICKSVDDPRYGEGREIEKDMFESNHIRHFFSNEYAIECLGDKFKILKIENGEENFYNSVSAFVKVIAEKI